MKKSFKTCISLFAGVILLAGTLPLAAVGFSEDFESGLSQWTGKGGGSHSGVIVADPLSSGRGGVLTFCNLAYGGDLFLARPLSISGPVLISFDYLGLALPNSVPGDLGGFLGTARKLDPGPTGKGNIWYAGTQNNYPGLKVLLVDDGNWHRYEIAVDGTALGKFRLILEDFGGSGGVAGDVFFDNISVRPITVVPEPTAVTMTAFGLILAFAAVCRRK